MPTTEQRARTLDHLELRALDDQGTKGWEFDALAVPWDTPDTIAPGLTEIIPRDCLTPAESVKLRFEHQDTIGRITETRSEEDGLYITARISDTSLGRDARALIMDGAITGLSIGFEPTVDPDITNDDELGTLITQRAGTIHEVSLVSFPAYKATTIQEIRHKEEEPMSDTTLAALSADLDALTRSVDLIAEKVNTAPTNPAPEYRSFGLYVKALATGDELAQRLYNGATTADDKTIRPAWVARIVDKMKRKQRVTELFTHRYDLPADGMSIEYPEFGEDSLAVAKQTTEGADLEYGKITLTTGSAPVNTYGGYSAVTRQQIERGSDVYLTTLFNRQALRYARAIEEATRALLTATITQRNESALDATKAATALTVNDIIALIVDAAQYYDDTDTTLDGLVVSADLFKHLATLDASPKALKFAQAAPGDNTQGTLNLPALTGSTASIPVTLIPGTNTMAFIAADALEIKESSGAPFRLQDENIINLSKRFAVYGYAAHFAPDPAGILPVKFA